MESEDFFLSCLKMFQLIEIEKLLLRMSLFTEGLKGSLHISEGHNVLYLGLHERENRINALVPQTFFSQRPCLTPAIPW